MKPYLQTAQSFGEALARGDYDTAHAMLAASTRKRLSAEALRKAVEDMIEASAGEVQPIDQVEVMGQFALEDWPAMQPGDVAHVYVALVGELFNEAVTVIVAADGDALRIRELEWGRP